MTLLAPLIVTVPLLARLAKSPSLDASRITPVPLKANVEPFAALTASAADPVAVIVSVMPLTVIWVRLAVMVSAPATPTRPDAVR